MNKRNWLVIILVVLALTGFIARRVLHTNRPRSHRAPPLPASSPAPRRPSPVQAVGVSYKEYDAQNNLLYEVEFETGEFDADRKLVSATGVKAKLIREGGPAILVQAPAMTAAQSDRILRFLSGAQAWLEDGSAHFWASALVWQIDTRKLISEQGGTFQYGGFKLTGHRLVWDTLTRRVRISGGGRLVRRG